MSRQTTCRKDLEIRGDHRLPNEVVREIDQRFERGQRAIEEGQEAGAAHFGQLGERVNGRGLLVQVAWGDDEYEGCGSEGYGICKRMGGGGLKGCVTGVLTTKHEARKKETDK